MDRQETIDKLTLENEELRKQNKANAQRIAELETHLKTFQAKLFGTKSACSLYSGFTGVLQCDGYQVYPKVACTDRVGCLAHVRRKFFEAAKYSQAAKGPLKILDQVFHQEKKWASLSSSARMSKRNEFLRPLFEKSWQTLATCAALLKSLLGKAIIAYALGQKEAIKQYGAIDISNNTCE